MKIEAREWSRDIALQADEGKKDGQKRLRHGLFKDRWTVVAMRATKTTGKGAAGKLEGMMPVCVTSRLLWSPLVP